MAKGQNTTESFMIANGKIGEHFYSDKTDRHLTALASYYNRRIKTERFLALSNASISHSKKNIESIYICKVTLLDIKKNKK